jgi:hypothetical protein
MGGILINAGVINYGGTPSIGANTSANRPAAGVKGRLFVDTTNSLLQYDTGSAWTTIGSGGGGITGTGAAGQSAFWTGATSVSGDNAFFWDNTNKRLGLGTTTPGVRLDVHGTGVLQQLNGTTTNNAYLDFQNAGTTQWRVGNTYNAGNRLFQILDIVGAVTVLTVNNLNNVSIGSNTIASFKLHAFGSLGSGSTVDNIGGSLNLIGANAGATLSITPDIVSGANGVVYNTSFVSGGSGPHLFQIGGVFKVAFTNTGVGIGYTSPAVGLATSGNASIGQNTANANYNLITSQFFCAGFSFTNTTVSTSTAIAAPYYSGYVCTATLTLTLPAVSGLNFIFYIIANSGATVTVQRSGSDVILDKLGVSQTSVVVAAGTRALFYLGGGSTTYQIF